MSAIENGLDSREVQPVKTITNHTHEFTPQDKRMATVIAQLALAGHQVHRLERGWIVTRWGMTKVCSDLGALVAFARQVGATQ
jgi:hypothetical protein